MNLPKLLFRLLLGHRLPHISGSLEVSGIEQSVLIRRDGYGIVYIDAQSDADAWYGLGFCQGQDRSFQLETLLRVVRGTISELIGPEGLCIDRLSRRIGFEDASERQLDILDKDTQLMLTAFAKGVTAGTQLGSKRPAHEYALLRAEPSAYCATDVLGVLKVMAFNLSSNWDSELARLRILDADGEEALAAVDPAYPQWLPTSMTPTESAGPALNRLSEDVATFKSACGAMGAVGSGGGSNNWAVAPSRTVTGRPILANDPHLLPTLPPYWYLASVRTPEWAVAGASFVGAPTFPIGHNGTGAWGITAGLVDNTDLFVEDIGPEPNTVREGSDFVACDVRREAINVKGAESVQEEVLVTPRGPIIGPALIGETAAISLRAVWLDAQPVAGLLCVHRARSFDEFRRAFAQWPALPLNLVYADVSETVGWQLVGEAPLRRKGFGTLPLPGWDPDAGWEPEHVPFDEMPYLEDPEIGFVATANSQPVPSDQTPFLGVDWIDGYRLARISELLDARKDWDISSTQALQMDQASLPWRELRDVILRVPSLHEDVRHALTLLESWGGGVAADSPAAALFELFLAELARRIARTKAPHAADWAVGKSFAPTLPHNMFVARRVGHLVRLVREQPAGWFEQSWSEVLADVLATALDVLRKQCGTDTAHWAWGQVRPLTLRHPVGDRSPLHHIFNLGPFTWGGDANTVSQAAVDMLDPTANPLFIASMRAVIDVGNWDASQFSLPGGQSGNPLSPHYADLLPFWRRGKGVSIAWSEEKVDAVAKAALRLVPGQAIPSAVSPSLG